MSACSRARPLRSLLVVVAALTLGCGDRGGDDGASAAGGFTVRDSAGVRIVESSGPALTGGARWSVEREPFLSIGVVEGEEPYLLNGVGNVQVLGDGRVLLSNGGDQTLRFYDADGRYLARAGRQGEGPGEFTAITAVRIRNDEITVHPFVSLDRAVEHFDLQGNYLRTVTMRALPALPALQIPGSLGDGTLVIWSYPQGGAPTPGAPVLTLPMPLFLVSPDGARSDSLTSVPGRVVVDVGLPGMVGQEYGPSAGVEVGSDAIHVGWPATHEVRVLDRNGATTRVQRWSGRLEPVTAADRDAHLERTMNLPMEGGGPVPESLARQRRQIVDGMIYPEHHRAYGRLLLDGTGHLWVLRFDVRGLRSEAERVAAREAAPVWDVFDPDGRWIDAVELPPGLQVTSIGRDHVAGVTRDELGVERAALFRLARGASGG